MTRSTSTRSVAVSALGAVDHTFVAAMVAYVGLDPRKDINWVAHAPPDALRAFTEGKFDAFMTFPPFAQEFRTRTAGHVVVKTATDRPWSQYFCCMLAANREFVRRSPTATKRALRAILKATDMCAAEPDRTARLLADKGYVSRYDLALQFLKDRPLRAVARLLARGHTTLLRPAPARGWDDQVEPAEAHRPGRRLAVPQRAEERAEGIARDLARRGGRITSQGSY